MPRSRQKTIPVDTLSEAPVTNHILHFPVWKTIVCGDGDLLSTEDVFLEFEEEGIRVGSGAQQILLHSPWSFSPKPIKVKLVLLCVANLRLDAIATLANIYQQAFKCGLSLCSLEVVCKLRLQHTHLQEESIMIATNPLSDCDDLPILLGIAKSPWSDDLFSRTYPANRPWLPHTRFVFTLP